MSDPAPTYSDTVVRAIYEVAKAATPWPVQAIIGSVQVVLEDVEKRRTHRFVQTAGDITRGVGGPDALADRLARSPEQEVQFIQAMDAATRSGLEAKRKLLVRAAVASLNDSAKFDESQLIIDALAELNTMHIRALVSLAEEVDEFGLWRQQNTGALPQMGHPDHYPMYLREHGNSPRWMELPAGVQAGLVRSGACTPTSYRPRPPGEGSRWAGPVDGITRFGIQLVRDLQAEAVGNDATSLTVDAGESLSGSG